MPFPTQLKLLQLHCGQRCTVTLSFSDFFLSRLCSSAPVVFALLWLAHEHERATSSPYDRIENWGFLMGVGEIPLTQQVCVCAGATKERERGCDSDKCARCGAEVKCVNTGRVTVPIIGFVTCVNLTLSQLAAVSSRGKSDWPQSR